ncbi:hypothetical protein [Candidatus Thiosymbion oneisti]|uniref:hypothetical protein n=1 Tax=Candidatus Thiosymbion oneisti TaxID=589554 RepID=UPI00159F117A|nr:hypothetical protein [Candidatus Thiosymbion oneisti]
MPDATHPLDKLVAILKRSDIESPCYLYDGDGAQSAVCDLTDTLEKHLGANTRVFLPVFANPCFPLLDLLVASAPGVGVLVNSLPELAAVRAFPWHVTPIVLFAGGVLTPADVSRVCTMADFYYATSWANLRTALAMDNRKATIGLRIDISNSGELRGIPVQDIPHLLSQQPAIATQVAAIHAYQGPDSPGFDACLTHADALLSLTGWFPELRQVNFSGGWPFDYLETSTPLPSRRQPLRHYLSHLCAKIPLADFCSDPVEIAFEPGKFLLAAYGYFFCRVIEESRTAPYQSDIHLDASFVHLPSLKLKNRQHAVSLFDHEWKIADNPGISCQLRGYSGLSTDFLMPGRVILPKPRSGDYLVVHDVGVYGWAGSYNFLGLQRPPEYVRIGDQVQLVRHRQREGYPLEGLIPLEFSAYRQTAVPHGDLDQRGSM